MSPTDNTDFLFNNGLRPITRIARIKFSNTNNSNDTNNFPQTAQMNTDLFLEQRIKTDDTDCTDYFLQELPEIDHALGTCDALLAKN